MIRLPLPACAPLLLLACVAPRTGPATRAVAPGVAATAIATAADSRGAEPVPEMQLPADVRPVRYALDLEVDPARDAGLRGRATIEVELDRQRRTIWLHARELRVNEVGVEVDGSQVPATFSQATTHPLVNGGDSAWSMTCTTANLLTGSRFWFWEEYA